MEAGSFTFKQVKQFLVIATLIKRISQSDVGSL
jgi:hypothetical protein